MAVVQDFKLLLIWKCSSTESPTQTEHVKTRIHSLSQMSAHYNENDNFISIIKLLGFQFSSQNADME